MRSQVKSECNTNFRKGNGSVIVNGSESTWRAASRFQRVHNKDVSETKWLRPVEGGDIIADSRQRERSRCYHCVTAGGGPTAHTHLWWATHTRRGPKLRSRRITSLCFESREHFEDQPYFLFVVPGGRRTQVSPWVLCVSELQGGDWGHGYLRLSREIETLLVRRPARSFFKTICMWDSDGNVQHGRFWVNILAPRSFYLMMIINEKFLGFGLCWPKEAIWWCLFELVITFFTISWHFID